MNCLCYFERKKQKIDKSDVKLIKNYWERIEKITSPKLDADGKNIKIECNYILCEKCVESGTEINVLLKNNHYAFCSENCWDTWLTSKQNLKHSVKTTPNISPLIEFDSPEYLLAYKNSKKISDIPPLFI